MTVGRRKRDRRQISYPAPAVHTEPAEALSLTMTAMGLKDELTMLGEVTERWSTGRASSGRGRVYRLA